MNTDLVTKKLTNSMERSPSWEASSHSASQKFLASYGIRRFITVFTTARHWPLSWASWTQSTPSYPVSLRSILILSCHLRLGIPSGLFPYSLLIKMYAYITPMRATYPPLIWSCPATVCHSTIVHLIRFQAIIIHKRCKVQIFGNDSKKSKLQSRRN